MKLPLYQGGPCSFGLPADEKRRMGLVHSPHVHDAVMAVRLRHFRKEKGQKGVSRYLHTWRWVSKVAEDIQPPPSLAPNTQHSHAELV